MKDTSARPEENRAARGFKIAQNIVIPSVSDP
jgi:hypothetical protein